MSELRLIGVVCVFAWMGRPGLLSAQPQDEIPTSAPVGGNADPAGGDVQTGLTLEEAVTRAYGLIETAEEKGADASAALKQLDTLLGFIRAKELSNVDADFLFGRMHLLLGRPREAIQYIDRYAASRKGANDWLAFKLLGDLYLQSKYYSMAADKFRKATELSPTQADPHAGLARAELENGHPVIAEGHARKAAELDAAKPPKERNPGFQSTLAESLLGQTKLDEALVSADLAAELGRVKVKEAPAEKERLEKLEGYLSLEEQVIRAVLKTYSERTAEYVRLARVVRERADVNHLVRYHNILGSLQAAIERTAPNTPPDLFIEQAKLFFAVGDAAKARTVLEELLSKDPENGAAKQLLIEIPAPPIETASQ